jgi:hypothetical protein
MPGPGASADIRGDIDVRERNWYRLTRDGLVVALLVAILGVGIYLATHRLPGPAGIPGATGQAGPRGATGPPVSTGSLGVCVSYTASDGTEYVSSLMAPVVDQNGVVSCQLGQLVPVAPSLSVGG